MSLQIAVAHTGQRLDVDPVNFGTIDALRQWVSSQTSIPTDSQILLTTRGKHVKVQALLTEREIFVFDRAFSSGTAPPIVPTPVPEVFVPTDPPDTLSSHTDLRAWQTLFQARRDWAFAALQKSHSMSLEASKHFAAQATIERGTQIAVGNHQAHIRSIAERYQAAKEWFEGVEREAVDNLERLDHDFGQLKAIPAKLEFVQFMTKELRSTQAAKNARKPSPNRSATLQDFLDVDAIKKATVVSTRIRESFGKHISELGGQVEKVTTDYNELINAVGQSESRSLEDDSDEPLKLYKEIDAVAKKVESDFEHVMELPLVPKSVAQVSKMALLHTRNFLPAIKDYCTEMSELLRRSVEQENYAAANAVESMHGIANIESVMTALTDELATIDIPAEGIAAFELISLVNRLPFIYGTLLVEAVRRHEWKEKMHRDSSSLAEEMATFQEEEERRRKRWLKPIADVVSPDAVQGHSLGFEMTISPEQNQWPAVTREDLMEYLKVLQGLEGHDMEVDSLSQAIRDMDRPTKQQVKRAKNFKMGSVHEPAFGKGSQLMLRGDDELRVLREANTKLEDELKGAKSRVRRLEDLLHRQSHVSRLSIGSGIPSFGPQSPADPGTPTLETPAPGQAVDHSRRSSVSSRRFSTNQGQEDKRRIVRLEQELAAEKEARAALEKDMQVKKVDEAELRRRAEEAVSTKDEIMENMKAQQREFAIERRSLEEEIQSHKGKIEEVEDELDRVLGSRDHERTGVDARIQELVSELEKIRGEAAQQSKQTSQQFEKMRAEAKKREEVEVQYFESLTAAFNHLSPNSDLPESYAMLVPQIEALAFRSYDHQQELQQAIAVAKTENENAHNRMLELEADFKKQLAHKESELSSLHEQLESARAKTASIASELEEERAHLHSLREKFAEGETGSEALRKRVEEEEERVGQMKIQLAESRSHANSLDVELMHLQKKVMKYEELDSSRTHERSLRTKELTKRLFGQQERLARLVEALGFMITHEDGAMVLQRASKVSNSTTLGETGTLSRTNTTPSPTPLKQFSESLTDLSFLQWPESASQEEEDRRYHELLDSLNRFDVDIFSEAVAKRMRDIEHTARKYQRDARNHREKAHRFQADAHEKIAYRSFKEGDLALFLPTRNQATRPWAAFNVGAPHYFLREQDSHRLHGREWLVARISKVEERIVDLSKTMDTAARASLDGRSIASNSAISFEDDNPFELSDGLRWYLLDAVEEKPGAPGTPGLGKTTVASARVTGQGQMEPTRKKSSTDPAKTLGKSLDSRRSSGTSKKSAPLVGARNSTEVLPHGEGGDSGPSSNNATRGASPSSGPGPSNLREIQGVAGVDKLLEGQDEVRKDHLWGP